MDTRQTLIGAALVSSLLCGFARCDVHARLHREARLAASGILLAVAQKRIVAQIEAISLHI